MDWGEASESDEDVSDTEVAAAGETGPAGAAPAGEAPSQGGGAGASPGGPEPQDVTDEKGHGAAGEAVLPPPPAAFMSMAKPLSHAIRTQLAGLIAEQERLLERMGEKHGAIEALPHVKEVRKVMERVPEYQKKLVWIKKSMARTQAIIDQTKRESLTLQEKVLANSRQTSERKRAEARRDEELKAKVVVRK